MRIAVSGSIATDHLMVFPGRFVDQLLPGQLAHASLSFLGDRLEVRRGGVAAHIAFGLGGLGLSPLLVGAVGTDFAAYEVWLKEHDVDTGGVHVCAERQTARFMCITDEDANQIAAFYAGAMTEAHDIDLRALVTGTERPGLVLISPDDPSAMLRHTAECRALGIPFAAAPSQQLARLDSDQVRDLVDGATWLFTNEYEAALLKEHIGWSRSDVLSAVGTWLTTLGEKGVRLERAQDSLNGMFRTKYQDCRYSLGYPACPALEDRAKIAALLRPERIGVHLSEEFQLHPEQSTDAIVIHHPEAGYFNAGGRA
ncbi:PfkB family carbohydrate kinase [Streptomyces sp. SD15]